MFTDELLEDDGFVSDGRGNGVDNLHRDTMGVIRRVIPPPANNVKQRVTCNIDVYSICGIYRRFMMSFFPWLEMA